MYFLSDNEQCTQNALSHALELYVTGSLCRLPKQQSLIRWIGLPGQNSRTHACHFLCLASSPCFVSMQAHLLHRLLQGKLVFCKKLTSGSCLCITQAQNSDPVSVGGLKGPMTGTGHVLGLVWCQLGNFTLTGWSAGCQQISHPCHRS